MRTILTLFLLGALVHGSCAQPTLTQASNAPVAGTQFTFHYGPHVAPGGGGAQQTWDLSTLGTDSTVQAAIVQASATPNGSLFPSATVAEVNPTVTVYYGVAGDGVYNAGSDDGSTAIVNAQMGRYLPYPCTFGTTWSGPESATFTADGMDVFRSGTVVGEADGYGTVVMPWGTVSNVLRVHWTSTLRDSTTLFAIDYTYDAYVYYVVGQSYPLAELVTAEVTLFGGTTTTQFSRWLAEISTGLDAPAVEATVLQVAPNPAEEAVRLSLPASFQGDVTVELVDAAGRTVRREQLLRPAGPAVHMALGTLTEGCYLVRAVDGEGHQATGRFIKR